MFCYVVYNVVIFVCSNGKVTITSVLMNLLQVSRNLLCQREKSIVGDRRIILFMKCHSVVTSKVLGVWQTGSASVRYDCIAACMLKCLIKRA